MQTEIRSPWGDSMMSKNPCKVGGRLSESCLDNTKVAGMLFEMNVDVFTEVL